MSTVLYTPVIKAIKKIISNIRLQLILNEFKVANLVVKYFVTKSFLGKCYNFKEL